MAKQERKKYGIGESPIPATRVLVKELDSELFGGKESQSLLIINDNEGTFTAGNVFGGNLGRNYDPTNYTHPLPEDMAGWMKAKTKKGYVEGDVADHDVLEAIEAEEAVEEMA